MTTRARVVSGERPNELKIATSSWLGLPGIGSATGSSTRARLALVGHLGLLAFLAIVELQFALRGYQRSELLDTYCGVLLVSFVWVLVSWLFVGGSLFDLYGLFVGVTFLFHGSYTVLRLLGQESLIYLLPDLSSTVLAESLLLVCIGVAFLHLGALLVQASDRNSKSLDAEGDLPQDFVRMFGWVLALIATPAMILEMGEGITLVTTGGYNALFLATERSAGTGQVLQNLSADFYLTGALFLMAGAGKRKIALFVSVLMIGMLAGYNLFLGHRAYAVLPVLGGVWLWHNTVSRFRLGRVSLIGTLVLLYISPIVRQLRGLAGSGRFSIETIKDTIVSLPESALSLLAEAGGTLMTVGYTLELVPAQRSFEGGATYLGAFGNVLPMFSWEQSYGYGSEWLAWTIKPDWAANGFGFGFSFLAEAYLNFGWVGVPLIAIAIGCAVVLVGKWARGRPARLAVVAVGLPIVLFFSRGESIDLVRPVVWRALVPYAALVLVYRLTKKSTQRRQAAGPRQDPKTDES